ncbi:MAG: hypothetical protein AB7U73_01195 [Pirellulales bacterium]
MPDTNPSAPPTPTQPTITQDIQFSSDEPLWYANGRWGDCGYAIPNPGGKTWTNNIDIYSLHELIGRNMFELAHRESVKFYTPPHKQYWWDLVQMLQVGIKRCADLAIAPNADHVLEAQHANPTPQVYLVFPIPYFGERIRQPDIKRTIMRMLQLLTEIMQHGDGDRQGYFTHAFAGMVTDYLQESLAWIATKYFGYTRLEVYQPGFRIADDRFTNYNPDAVMTSVEMTEERQPPLWWPTENDLSRIRGIPVNDAIMFAKRWPNTDWKAVADGNVLVNRPADDPGGSNQNDTAAIGLPNRAP